MEQIEIGTDAWDALKREIVSEFSPGQLISHIWLWNALGLDDFRAAKFEDYGTPAELIAAVKKADLDYMDLVSELHHQLLFERKGLLVNLFGRGYMMLPADEQVVYAFDKFINKVSRLI